MTDKEREIRERLEAQGIKVGQWNHQGEREVRPQFSGNIMALLKELRGVVQKQLQHDVHTVQQLREAANRARYGGGK